MRNERVISLENVCSMKSSKNHYKQQSRTYFYLPLSQRTSSYHKGLNFQYEVSALDNLMSSNRSDVSIDYDNLSFRNNDNVQYLSSNPNLLQDLSQLDIAPSTQPNNLYLNC